MDIVEKIIRMIKMYTIEHGQRPNAIYAGYKERIEILKSNEAIPNFQMPEKDKEKLFNIDLIEVSRENYLKVGYVSDTN